MACCLLCFSDSPHPKDQFGTYQRNFQVNLMDACSADPACCAFGFICPCAAAYKMRQKVLFNDMSRYLCCQGEVGCCGCKGGKCGEKNCPFPCLCIEVCCFPTISLSSSRVYLMRKFQISCKYTAALSFYSNILKTIFF